VEILRQACIKYRAVMIQGLGVDPWCFTTLSSMCMSVFRTKFLKHRLGKELHTVISKSEHAWLAHVEDEELGYQLHRNVSLHMLNPERERLLEEHGSPKCGKCGRRCTVRVSRTKKNPGRPYWAASCCREKQKDIVAWVSEEDVEQWTTSLFLRRDKDSVDWASKNEIDVIYAICDENRADRISVDAFDPKTKTVYLYHGCRWHGCSKCSHGSSKADHGALLCDTLHRRKVLEDNGYTVRAIWGCEDDTPRRCCSPSSKGSSPSRMYTGRCLMTRATV